MGHELIVSGIILSSFVFLSIMKAFRISAISSLVSQGPPLPHLADDEV